MSPKSTLITCLCVTLNSVPSCHSWEEFWNFTHAKIQTRRTQKHLPYSHQLVLRVHLLIPPNSTHLSIYFFIRTAWAVRLIYVSDRWWQWQYLGHCLVIVSSSVCTLLLTADFLIHSLVLLQNRLLIINFIN